MEVIPPPSFPCLAIALDVTASFAVAFLFAYVVSVPVVEAIPLVAPWVVVSVGHPAGGTRALLSIFIPSSPPSRHHWGSGALPDSASTVVVRGGNIIFFPGQAFAMYPEAPHNQQ